MQQFNFPGFQINGASLDAKQQIPVTTPHQFIRHKQSSETSLKGIRQDFRGHLRDLRSKQRNFLHIDGIIEHRTKNNAIGGDNLNVSFDASPIILAGQSAFDSIKNSSPKKDSKSTRVGASGCFDISPQILDDLHEPHVTVGSGLLENTAHFQSQNVGVEQSISLLNHNLQNRNKVALHSHCVSKKASQCEMETSLPIQQSSMFPHHGSMASMCGQNAVGHIIAGSQQQVSSRNGLYQKNLSNSKDTSYRALNAPFMPRSGMTSIEHSVLQGGGNAQNNVADRNNIHGSCGRASRPKEGEFRNMKDFLNIQIATEGDFVQQKGKSQSLSPTKLNQSKICSNNGQMILNLNKNMMQSLIKNTNEPEFSCSKQDQPQ